MSEEEVRMRRAWEKLREVPIRADRPAWDRAMEDAEQAEQALEQGAGNGGRQ